MAKTSPSQFVRQVRQEAGKIVWPHTKRNGHNDPDRVYHGCDRCHFFCDC
jgi:SecE/Sec61-gamma subunits of protein translocation complex.